MFRSPFINTAEMMKARTRSQTSEENIRNWFPLPSKCHGKELIKYFTQSQAVQNCTDLSLLHTPHVAVAFKPLNTFFFFPGPVPLMW